jgi:hypothetical protein
MANKKISQLTEATSVTGSEYAEITQSGVNKKAPISLFGPSREFNRAFTETLIFDKNEIEYDPYEATGDLTFQLGSGHLTDQFSGAAMPIIFDGTQAVNFPVGWRLLGITNGQIPEAGSYEVYFLYSNGNVRVNFPGVTQEQSGVTQLLTPSDFAVVEDGPNALDMSWSDVSNEVGYQIERSLTGTSGWTLYSNPAANATSDTETGLAPNTTIFYRIKAIGDGVSYSDSPYTVAAATTENTGDILAPTFTWNPVNGSAIWPVNKAFTITANEPMRKDDGTAIVSNVAGIITLKQTNSGGANIAHSWTINAEKTIITVTPTTTLGTNQLVYVAIDGVEDGVGNEIALTSITFTTTAFTYYNGTSNRMIFGDILDDVFAANDTNFWIERTLNNANLSGSRVIWAKMAPGASTECFRLYYNNTGFVFYFSMVGLGNRAILWTGTDMDAGENVIVLKYDGSIDTNDGLDRCTLLINGVIQSTKEVTNPSGSLNGSLQSVAAQLAAGIDVNSAGTPGSALWYEGEAKDSIIRSAAGATVELNVAVDRVGTDSSGNARNGTWV